jgi:hypothetical protein
MKTLGILILTVMVSACSMLPAKPKWPAAPKTLTNPCPELNTVETEKLSELLDTVVDNYALYHECAAKNAAWNQWYQEQKRVYEEIK